MTVTRSRLRAWTYGVIVIGGTLGAAAAPAGASVDTAGLAYEERPGSAVPMNVPFRDADGQTRSLADIAQGRPMILVPAWYDCTSLCGLVRSSLYGGLGKAGSFGGYAIAIVSIDPTEKTGDARTAQAHDQPAIDALAGVRPHYLTGTAAGIRAVTEAVGFHDRRDPASGQFLHPAGVVFVTARGTVSGYLLGVGYTPAQVRSALLKAQSGLLAEVGAPLLLLCFHLDETTGRYSLEIMKVVRLAGLLMVLTLCGVMVLLFRRERS